MQDKTKFGDIISGVIIALVVFFIVGVGISSDKRSKDFLKVADCVIDTAQAQEYAGNPNSVQAWELFAPTCRESLKNK